MYDYNQKIRELKASIVLLTEQVKDLEAYKKRLETSISLLNRNASQKSEKIQEASKAINTLKDTTEQTKQNLEAYKKQEFSEVDKEIDNRRAKIEEQEKIVKSRESEIAQKLSLVARKESEVKIAWGDIAKKEKELREATQRVTDTSKILEKRQFELDTLLENAKSDREKAKTLKNDAEKRYRSTTHLLNKRSRGITRASTQAQKRESDILTREKTLEGKERVLQSRIDGFEKEKVSSTKRLQEAVELERKTKRLQEAVENLDQKSKQELKQKESLLEKKYQGKLSEANNKLKEADQKLKVIAKREEEIETKHKEVIDEQARLSVDRKEIQKSIAILKKEGENKANEVMAQAEKKLAIVNQKEHDLEVTNTLYINERSALKSMKDRLEREQKDLLEKISGLEDRELSIQKGQELLEERERVINKRESEITGKESDITHRLSTIEEKEVGISKSQKDIESREHDLELREAKLKSQQATLEVERQEVSKLKVRLASAVRLSKR